MRNDPLTIQEIASKINNNWNINKSKNDLDLFSFIYISILY